MVEVTKMDSTRWQDDAFRSMSHTIALYMGAENGIVTGEQIEEVATRCASDHKIRECWNTILERMREISEKDKPSE